MINVLYGLPTVMTAFVLIGTIVSPLLAGSADTPSPLIRLLRKNYDPSQSIATHYALTIYWSVREKEEKRQGNISLASGDRFCITAGDERIISNGTTYWHYTPQANQVVIKNLKEVDLSLLPSQLFARFIVSCPFKQVRSEKGVAEFIWTSDSTGAPYQSIIVKVKEKDGRIDACVMTDRNGNLFTYTFTATTLGKKIPGRTFEFAIPKSARIIDLRK
jgi:outer membrane lipoprotein-sorting protein